MSQHYYAEGAKHIDHHKEININLSGKLADAQEAIARLSKDFFAEDDAEDASFEEAEDETTASGSEYEQEEIPRDCTDAVGRVLVPQFTINSAILNSMKQLHKASEQINLTSNSEVAMLMAIGQEVNAVRPGCSCPDFVRALIGMRIIAFTDKKAIDKMADGMTKKLNGYAKGGTTYPPLPSNHLRWNTNDLPIGKRIFEAMTTQE